MGDTGLNCTNRTEENCELEPNCRKAYRKDKTFWRCQKRNGVESGTRYHFVDGKAVPIDQTQPGSSGTPQPGGSGTPQPGGSGTPQPGGSGTPQPGGSILNTFIGKGTTGISFFPAFECATDKIDKAYLGKVFINNKDAQEEWDLTEKIRTLPGNNNLVYPVKQCKIRYPKTEGPLKDWLDEKYSALKQKNPKSTPPTILTQHLMPYHGNTLDHYINTYYDKIQISRVDFIYILEKLFWGIDFLFTNGIVHQDIKSPNVVISNQKGLHIIDFGWAVEVENYYKLVNSMLITDYIGVSPTENSIFRYIYNNFTTKGINPKSFIFDYECKYKFTDTIDTNQSINQFIKQVDDIINPRIKEIRNLDFINEKLVYDDVQPFLVELIKYKRSYQVSRDYLKYFTDDQIEIVHNIIKLGYNDLLDFWKTNNLASKYDIYSVGMTIHSLLQRKILLDKRDDNPEAVKLFNELVSGITRFNPLIRLDPGQAYKIVQEIIKINYSTPQEQAEQLPEIQLNFPTLGINEQLEKVIHAFPFEKNQDIGQTKLFLSMFGSSRKIKEVLSDLKYLKRLK
jgi:serine/threonine protein kinase